MKVPGGGASCLGVGHPGSGALPTPTARPLGLATGAHYPLAVGAGLARCGGGVRGPGGGASCLGLWRPGSGAPPTPTTRPFRRAAGAHYPLAVGAGAAGVGTHHQPHSAHSCQLALRVVGAA